MQYYKYLLGLKLIVLMVSITAMEPSVAPVINKDKRSKAKVGLRPDSKIVHMYVRFAPGLFLAPVATIVTKDAYGFDDYRHIKIESVQQEIIAPVGARILLRHHEFEYCYDGMAQRKLIRNICEPIDVVPSLNGSTFCFLRRD